MAALPDPRQVLVELRSDGHDRIERGQRRLRDEGDGAAERARAAAPVPRTGSSPSNHRSPP
jgi:hypothetical protein